MPAPKIAPEHTFTSKEQLRANARRDLTDGAVTESYGADREQVIEMLNHALATELVCTLRYRHHYFVAEGLPAEAIKQEFLDHANEEQAHADMLAGRIVQLGGNPNFNPEGLAERSHAEYGKAGTLPELLRDDLIAERVAIQSYTEMIGYLNDKDPTSKRMLESILATEEEHAEEIASMLANLDQWKTRTTKPIGTDLDM